MSKSFSVSEWHEHGAETSQDLLSGVNGAVQVDTKTNFPPGVNENVYGIQQRDSSLTPVCS